MPEHIPRLLKLAGPLILSTSSIMAMQIIDTFVLSRHSSAALAAIGPSSLAVVLFQGFLFGTAAYAGTFVAHSHGRGDARGVRQSAWLGIHASLLFGITALAAAWPLGQLFLLFGHEPQVARCEQIYFRICMAGSFFPVLGGAFTGWLSGIGRPRPITRVTLVSFAVNAVLTWGLVQGKWGLPRMGIAGAATGTVIAGLIAALWYTLLFARSGGLGDPAARCIKWTEFRYFLSRAMPMGLRISAELVAWTLFLVVVGRLGMVELAASSIAVRINGIAFFPAIGLSQAAGVLVGQARGAGRDNEVPAIAHQSLTVCSIWMLAMALLFITVPEQLVSVFAGTGPEREGIIAAGVLILKFVALYCLLDGVNIMMGWVLAAAGETRWVARAYLLSSAVFLAVLWLIDWCIPGLVAEWVLATIFIFSTAVLWLHRFESGAWKTARVLQDTDTP